MNCLAFWRHWSIVWGLELDVEVEAEVMMIGNRTADDIQHLGSDIEAVGKAERVRR